ncbi:MAG TPA: hypothetical protein VG101_01540 [Puia sp.]|jgi:hypothetical protein|nr:hypothetical protein [Puia sp.]
MRKTKEIQLVLITALFASCHQPEPQWRAGGRTHIRSDSTAPYTLMAHPNPGAPLLFYAFHPYGLYTAFGYRRMGYYSSALSEEVNIGHNAFKSRIVRGGFGESALSVES